MTEFVEDWSILHTLGEGAFGEVKLLVHRITGDAVAVKIIDCEKHKDATQTVKKEICIHKLLVHPNIIRYFGQRKESVREYIFLEYASGGELFNKIEPDIGMPSKEAQTYFHQLLSGVSYLHTKGIAHRDIKPENLLLDSDGTLKITDFGMATVFRLRGKERLLEKRCGTLPYLAPEVLSRAYKAQPADLWSCGVVLAAMLSGELPWDQPSEDYAEYSDWVDVDGKYMLLSPWKKLDTMVLSLIRCILLPDPENRFTIKKILDHRWMKTIFLNDEDTTDHGIPLRPAKRLCSTDEISLTQKTLIDNLPLGLSQPNPQKEAQSTGQVLDIIQGKDRISFSQPVHFDDLILGSQIQFTQSPISKNNFDKLVCRMTRFFVTTDCEKTLNVLCSSLEKLSYSWNIDNSGLLTISTVDSRKMQLVFKANIINMDGKLLLDFRLSKGCGIEFKKRFVQIKNSLRDIIFQEENK